MIINNKKELLELSKRSLKKDKYILIYEMYTEEFCREIREYIDSDDKNVECNYNNSEKRIWSAEKRDKNIRTFYNDTNKLMSEIYKNTIKSGQVLAIKNTKVNMNDTSLITGRWHIDSWSSQRKVFLFLSDTNEETGPFEFIPNTHKFLFRLKKALTPGFFFNFKEIFKRDVKRPYQSISDENIQNILDSGYKVKSVTVPAGTVAILNTSYLIHRAKPCIKGSRYALTSYFDT